MKKMLMAVFPVVVLSCLQGTGAVSEPVSINTSPTRNMRWSTVTTSEVTLQWEWPAEATQARLEIVGMNKTTAVDFTEPTSSWIWQVFTAEVPTTEDLFSLTLTFMDAGSDVVDELTAQLAVVTSGFGETVVIPSAEDQPWPTLKENVVIPYDAEWLDNTVGAESAQITIARMDDAMTQSETLPGESGFFGWKLKERAWGYGDFGLSLVFADSDSEWEALLRRISMGTVFNVK